jgi:hypothetical protein
MIVVTVLLTFIGTSAMWMVLGTLADPELKEDRLARRYQRRLERLERRTTRKITRRDWS